MTPYFDYRHTVGLEETNLVGNVYFTHFVRWQGRCREMFLREHAPDMLTELREGLKIFTIVCSCEYLAEVSAFDDLSIRMRLEEMTQTQIAFGFEYVRLAGAAEEPVAGGRQRVVCMRTDGERTVPARVPGSLRQALVPFAVPAAQVGV